jgi:hypothetical protein
LTAYNHRASYCDGDNQCLNVIHPDTVLASARACLQDMDRHVDGLDTARATA